MVFLVCVIRAPPLPPVPATASTARRVRVAIPERRCRKFNATRSAELFTNHLVAPSDNDKAIADLHQAEAMVKIKEAALEKAKVDFARCTITAPVDGVVISRNVQTIRLNSPVSLGQPYRPD